MEPTPDKPNYLDTPKLLLLTLAAGLAIGNLYWAQPLLAEIATYFAYDPSEGGLLITATQIGYALGILLIVPLGDFLQRQKLIPLMLGLTVATLILSGAAPSFTFLALTLALMGVVTVTGQLIIPLVGDLAPPDQRGRMLGTVASGITSGILLSRFLSGLIAGILGWRSIYFLAATLNLALLFLLARRLPKTLTPKPEAYLLMLSSVFSTALKVPKLYWITLLSGLAFFVFNLFWVSLTFLLSGAPFNYSTFQIGLVSLAGFSGALAAQRVGRLADQGRSVPALRAFIFLMALAMLLYFYAKASLILVLLTSMLVSIASQGLTILTQTTLFSLVPKARSRLNTVYVVNLFIFGALGSATASYTWNQGGLALVSLVGLMLCVVAFFIWSLDKPSP